MRVYRTAVYHVGEEGAVLEAVSLDGEVVSTLVLPFGSYSGVSLLQGLPADTAGEIMGAAMQFAGGAKWSVSRHGAGQFASAANADYRPQPGARQAGELARALQRLSVLERRVRQQSVLQGRAGAVKRLEDAGAGDPPEAVKVAVAPADEA